METSNKKSSQVENLSNYSLDLTFITNEPGKSLKDRFVQLIKDARFFDCLTAYFYFTGFKLLSKPLERSEKIRILIGIEMDERTYELIGQSYQLSHVEAKQIVENKIIEEMENSDDSEDVEREIQKFIDWIKNGKIEIRAYPSRNVHAKLYIITFKEGDRDIGRVITGSSNFTQSGLEDNLEFNVELKNRSDYEFAKERFEELWKQAVDVTEKYVHTIKEKTWLNDNITPYELYLKFLYEYFKDELSTSDELFLKYQPENFKKLGYQEQAVLNAKKILEEYGGVFISDVVGLGKTYITAMICGQL
ncbi:MAG: phospholipase D-like domain-containing protein, partial [Brevinematia bacterium]